MKNALVTATRRGLSVLVCNNPRAEQKQQYFAALSDRHRRAMLSGQDCLAEFLQGMIKAAQNQRVRN